MRVKRESVEVMRSGHGYGSRICGVFCAISLRSHTGVEPFPWKYYVWNKIM